jgi:tRNA 2-selenouridine synthase
VPQALIEPMRASPCVALDLPLEARVALLMRDYRHFVTDTPAFCQRLDALRVLRGNEMINGWQEAARAGQTEQVARDLLLAHYDPIYLQSMRRNFGGFSAPVLEVGWNGSAEALDAVASRLIAME